MRRPSETAEQRRLDESRAKTAHWKRWGPYLSERSWGTVREDYSADGSAWTYFPHDHARSRAYRWNEDGIAGICDRHQVLCFALALWNERDPILKERLFGLSGPEGNHGEDVKECYYYLDNTPTHSYMRMLYKYPQREFPYSELVEVNKRRGRAEPEYDLADTGIFEEDRYFDVTVEYAKAHVEDVLVRITVVNRGPEPAPLHLLPTLWYRNTWSWTNAHRRPSLCVSTATREGSTPGWLEIESQDPRYGRRYLFAEGAPEALFTENETNTRRLYDDPHGALYVKDGFHDAVIHGAHERVHPEQIGTKCAVWYQTTLAPGEERTFRLRMTPQEPAEYRGGPFGAHFDATFRSRQREADQFYDGVIPKELSAEAKAVMRQAFAGLLWSKQHYHYVVRDWLNGDPAMPSPPESRLAGRNSDWTHLYNADILSMPDTWEYPWYASWDLAFHCIPLALVDSEFAKHQLTLLLREWYMHPNGQLPAYEWALSDANPPVHAWAALRVYQIERKRTGVGDTQFLERVFQKLMLNFTWWVNRKDRDGRNVFEGGFLGLDNIGVFDRSAPLPTGGFIEQADGTAWMGMYCLNMLAIALELARENPVYEDTASKFWEHFVFISHALNNIGDDELQLWDEDDGFYYDVLRLPNDSHFRLKIRSMVGLIPLFAVETLETELLGRLPGFTRRFEWFLENRQDLLKHIASMVEPGDGQRRLMAMVAPERLRRVLSVMLDSEEFLSPYGIRSLSAHHREHPYQLNAGGQTYSVDYEPGNSTTDMFGGNSNWRGPIWFPVNYLLIESLQRFHHYLGDGFKVELPTGSGNWLNLWDVAAELSRRLSRLFLRDENGLCAAHGDCERHQSDPNFRDHLLFYEFFHGDTGQGLGASHQTGWTALVAKLLQQSGV